MRIFFWYDSAVLKIGCVHLTKLESVSTPCIAAVTETKLFSFNIFGKKKAIEGGGVGGGGGGGEQGNSSASATSSRPRPRDQLKDQAKEWKSVLRKEVQEVKRKERQLQRHVDETRAICKAHLKAGRRSNALQLVGPIKNAQDGVQRLKLQVVSLESAISRIEELVNMALITSSMKMSTDMSRELMRVFKAREMSRTVKNLADEMQRAGILQEVIQESIEEEFAMGGDEQIADEIAAQFLAEIEAGRSVSSVVKESAVEESRRVEKNEEVEKVEQEIALASRVE